MIKAADSQRSGSLTKEDIQSLLKNIGANESFTSEELDMIITEGSASKEHKALPVEKMLQLL